ncbi:YkvA family protein [Sorangium sp. So ce1335]|uniref:YkvA family protein n=1 Tax=Sorangium sp. So ce1335 TaxID=3133335 RepID=UPI003F643E29
MRAPSFKETAIFERLCGPATPEEVVALRRAVSRHVEELRHAARYNELLPVDVAEELGRRLDGLLAGQAAFATYAQMLIVGAARYFVANTDAVPDTSGVLGLDDDMAVFNAMVRRIGRADLEIDE